MIQVAGVSAILSYEKMTIKAWKTRDNGFVAPIIDPFSFGSTKAARPELDVKAKTKLAIALIEARGRWQVDSEISV